MKKIIALFLILLCFNCSKIEESEIYGYWRQVTDNEKIANWSDFVYGDHFSQNKVF